MQARLMGRAHLVVGVSHYQSGRHETDPELDPPGSDGHASECSGSHRMADADQAGGELREPVLADDDGAAGIDRHPTANKQSAEPRGVPPATTHGLAFNRPPPEIFLVELWTDGLQPFLTHV